MMYLNVPKSICKWCALKHLGEQTRAEAQGWFKSIGIFMDLRHKDSGRDRQEKWCSGDQWARLINGCPKNPYGMDGLVTQCADWLVQEHCLEMEADENNSSRCAAVVRIRQQWDAFNLAPNGSVQSFFASLLGKEASSRVVTAILAFTALHELTKAIHDPWHDESDPSERESRAYRVAIAAIHVATQWEAASSGAHRSWYMHIMLYILPRQVAALGDLWRFSSSPLEARGAMLQRTIRTSYTFRPTLVHNPGKKTKGDYRGNTLVNAATLVEAGKFLDI